VLANLALACPRCNESKSDRVRFTDPMTGRNRPLFNPRTQRWQDHFRWSAEDAVLLDGKTGIGRATIACLQMNHPDMMLARRWQAILGRLYE
jgi:hypothetical protein